MATKDNIQNLVSNPVFLAPQMVAQEGAETHSQILYANRFSGLPEVSMDQELIDLFNDESLNLTDTNFRLQLQHILEEYDAANGPWYIEGHNGVIHIHNRKIGPSAFVYRYQDENGEVLKVQITTNWTTGSSSGTVASVINNNKGREITRIDLPEEDFTEPNTFKNRPLRHWLPQDNTRVSGTEPSWGVSHVDSEGRVIQDGVEGDAWRASIALNTEHDLTPLPTLQESFRSEDIKFRAEKAARDKRQKELLNSPSKAAQADRDYINSFIENGDEAIDEFQQKLLEEFKKITSAGTEEIGEDIQRIYEKVYKQVAAGQEVVLTPAEQRLASQRIYLDDPDFINKFGAPETTRTITYKNLKRVPGQSWGYGATGGSSSPVGKPGTVVSALTVQELQEKLVKAGVGAYATTNGGLAGSSSALISDGAIIKEVNARIRQAQESGGGALNTNIGNIQVTINPDGTYNVAVTVAGRFGAAVSLLDSATTFAKRDTIGKSKKARALAYVNKLRNRTKKAKHKEIEVQMIVVGRPSLEAGQYLDILNIGQKYSGQWYIKTCIHQIDSNGYTCSLTLKKNQATPNGSAISVNKTRTGETSGAIYQVHTQDGVVELNLSASDRAVLRRYSLQGAQNSFNKFVRTAIYAQQNGMYGEGLTQPSNLQSAHMDGRENPDLEFEFTPEGKEAAKAYTDDRAKKVKAAAEAKKKLANSAKSKLIKK